MLLQVQSEDLGAGRRPLRRVRHRGSRDRPEQGERVPAVLRQDRGLGHRGRLRPGPGVPQHLRAELHRALRGEDDRLPGRVLQFGH